MIYYTYVHHRGDNNKVFYVGKGKGNRAWSKTRKQYWKDIVNEVGYSVVICGYWPTEEEAYEHEIFLIECFKKIGHPIANKSLGGGHNSGWKWTEDQKNDYSKKREGENNPMFGKSAWNRGMTGLSIGVKKGTKRPGVGGVKVGNIPWNKGISGYSTSKKGSISPKRQLSREDILDIRSSDLSARKLSKKYNIANSAIRNIIKGVTYKDVI